jgi:hypothetical protein
MGTEASNGQMGGGSHYLPIPGIQFGDFSGDAGPC